jgi:phosphate transport system permease protein
VKPKLIVKITDIYGYFRTKNKTILLTGSLLFLAGTIACLPGVLHLFNCLSEDGFTIIMFDQIVADTAYSILMILPSVILFSIGYMLWESHALAWKLSYITSIAVIILAVTNNLNIELALAIAALSGLAATLQLQNLKTSSSKHKDSPAITEKLAKIALFIASMMATAILIGMIVYMAVRASPYLSWDFITNLNWSWNNAAKILNGAASGSMGGVLGYTIGSLLLVSFCELIAIPLGLGAAIYLAEYATQNKLTNIVRFFIETLAGVPSVIIALVGYGFFVLGTAHWGYSLFGGGLALAFMILPWNIRIAEEALKSVPNSYREAAFALGATQWQTVRGAVLFAALPGIITGILLGVGAALGETIVVAMTAGVVPEGPQVLPAITKSFPFYQNIPTLTVFIWKAPLLLTFNTGVSGTATNIVFKMYSVTLAAAFVLVIIYLAICAIALILRNHLTKKIMGS